MNDEKRAARAHGRFWAKVEKTDGCWLWTASGNVGGYGQFWHEGTFITAHRAALILSGVRIPTGMHVDHLCRVRACVNPAHLEIVTAKENNRRSTSPSAANATKTHCPQGHPYDEVNTYVNRRGGRMCRACLRAAWRARYGTGAGRRRKAAA